MLKNSYMKKYKVKGPYDLEEKYLKDDDNYIINSYRPNNEKTLSNLTNENFHRFVDDILNSKKVSTVLFSTNAEAEINLSKKGEEAIKKYVCNLSNKKNKANPGNIFLKRKKQEAIESIKYESELFKEVKQYEKKCLEEKNSKLFNNRNKIKQNEIKELTFQNYSVLIKRFDEIYNILKEKILRYKDFEVFMKKYNIPDNIKCIEEISRYLNAKEFEELQKLMTKEYISDYSYENYTYYNNNNQNNNYVSIANNEENLIQKNEHLNSINSVEHKTSNKLVTMNTMNLNKTSLVSNKNVFSFQGNINNMTTNHSTKQNTNDNNKFTTLENIEETVINTKPSIIQSKNKFTAFISTDENLEKVRKHYSNVQKSSLPKIINLPDFKLNNDDVYSRLYHNSVFYEPKNTEINLDEVQIKKFEEKNKVKVTYYEIKSILGALPGKEFTIKITNDEIDKCFYSLSNGPLIKIKEKSKNQNSVKEETKNMEKIVKKDINKMDEKILSKSSMNIIYDMSMIKDEKLTRLINLSDSINGNNYLHKAVIDQVPELVCYFIGKKININCQNKYKETPLIIAIKLKNKSIIKILLDNNANVNLVDIYGHNCLFYSDVSY